MGVHWSRLVWHNFVKVGGKFVIYSVNSNIA